MGDYQEIAEALQEERTARQAAESGQRQEAAARQATEERLRQLEAELRRLRGES